MFWERFKELCDLKNLSPNAVVKELGFSNAICTHWKNGKKPSGEKLIAIANYFDVSVNYLLGKNEPALEPNVEFPPIGNVYYRPIFDSVSAGLGAPGDNIAVGLIPLYISNPADVEDTICINVKGDSMYPKIEDGDTIVIRKQGTLQNGEIGVVRYSDEFFVKRVEFEDNALRLVSINPEYAPKVIKGPELEQAEIVGKVIKIIKDL